MSRSHGSVRNVVLAIVGLGLFVPGCNPEPAAAPPQGKMGGSTEPGKMEPGKMAPSEGR